MTKVDIELSNSDALDLMVDAKTGANVLRASGYDDEAETFESLASNLKSEMMD